VFGISGLRLAAVSTVFALALVAGCAAMQAREKLEHAHGTPIIVVENPSFDGSHLTGRLLITSNDAGYVVIDRRFAEFSHIPLVDVRDCDGGRTIDYVQVCGIRFRTKPEDLLSIEPGYWYGIDFSFYVIDPERLSKVPPPDCIQVFLSLDLEAAAPGTKTTRFMVQADLARPDGGTP
jgi:hypothetical protein